MSGAPSVRAGGAPSHISDPRRRAVAPSHCGLHVRSRFTAFFRARLPGVLAQLRKRAHVFKETLPLCVALCVACGAQDGARAQRPETRPAATRPSAARTRVAAPQRRALRVPARARPAVGPDTAGPAGRRNGARRCCGSDQPPPERASVAPSWRAAQADGPAIPPLDCGAQGCGRRKSWQPEESRQLPDPGRRLHGQTPSRPRCKTHIETAHKRRFETESGEPYGRYRNS